jgi:GTP cyclohydrolase II
MAVTIRASVTVPLERYGCSAIFHTFNEFGKEEEHLVLQVGVIDTECPTVRIHSECLTGDVFGSLRCDCGPQLKEALDALSQHGGYLIYLRQEGRGIGLYSKFDAYLLQDAGMDTFEANTHLHLPEDERDFSIAAQMLVALGIRRCHLITNNPDKIRALNEHGVTVAKAIHTSVFVTSYNYKYLKAKIDKMNHNMTLTPMK